jgi:biopolymer transport protein ExbB
LLEIIKAAGWPIWFLLLASVIAVALVIERLITLRRKRIVPPDLLENVVAVYRKQGVTQEMLARLAQDSPLGQVLAAGLRNVKSSRYVMKEAIEEAGRAVTHELERFLTTLGTIATATPLLGLFGTVVGMIEIFGSQSPTGGSNPQALAHGISVALYNTGFGLIIAIPALIFFRHFRATVDSFVVEMEQQAAKLVDVVHGERFDFAGAVPPQHAQAGQAAPPR